MFGEGGWTKAPGGGTKNRPSNEKGGPEQFQAYKDRKPEETDAEEAAYLKELAAKAVASGGIPLNP